MSLELKVGRQLTTNPPSDMAFKRSPPLIHGGPVYSKTVLVFMDTMYLYIFYRSFEINYIGLTQVGGFFLE